jgi:hypothetical protein
MVSQSNGLWVQSQPTILNFSQRGQVEEDGRVSALEGQRLEIGKCFVGLLVTTRSTALLARINAMGYGACVPSDLIAPILLGNVEVFISPLYQVALDLIQG